MGCLTIKKGITTKMVMHYIIFINGPIHKHSPLRDLDPPDPGCRVPVQYASNGIIEGPAWNLWLT